MPGGDKLLRWPTRHPGLATLAVFLSAVSFVVAGHSAGQALSCGDQAHFVSSDVPKSIPDPGTTSSTLVIPTGGFIQDLDVSVDVAHPFDSDLRIDLAPPTGPPVTLADTVGMWGDDFTGTTFDDEASTHVVSALPPFAGRLAPNEQLSILDRTDRIGTWTLRVTDQRGGYGGILSDWSLDVTTCEDITPPRGQAITGKAFSKPFQRTRSFEVQWAAGSDDGTGVASRDVNYWSAPYDGGFGDGVTWQRATTSLAANFTGSPGTTYCFAERLRDRAGNVSEFSSQECTGLPVNDDVLHHSNGWKERHESGYYLNDYSISEKRGATLTLPVDGRVFAIVATTCPGCGSIDLSLGKTHLKWISLGSAGVHKDRVIPIKSFSDTRNGTLRIVVASSGRKVIVEGLGVTRPPIPQLPVIDANAGAPPLPQLPSGVPSGDEGVQGTVITVTTNSDASNGDVSTVAHLQATPGPDGISLREAIQATNNDPAQYTIRFASALKGTTINVGSGGDGQLPQLTGGGVFIDGDIDADGLPDITLQPAGANAEWGLILSSATNRLHALSLRGFSRGVGLGAFVPTTTQAASNTISGLVLMDIGQLGIAGAGGRIDTRIIGNTIHGLQAVTAMDLQQGSNDVERVTVAGNAIFNDVPSDFEGAAINFGPGNGAGSDNNVLSDVVVAYNSIEGATGGIVFLSGQVGAQGNLVEHIRILGNRTHLTPATNSSGQVRISVLIAAGDGASNEGCPACLPIVYPDENVVRDVEISGNSLAEGRGVAIGGGCCGAAHDTVRDIRIDNNLIRGVGPSSGVSIHAAGSGGTPSRLSFDDEVAGVSVTNNTIIVASSGGAPASPNGGIYLLGAERSQTSRVQDIHVTNNRIDTEMIGIHLIGGFTFLPPQDLPASGNTVFQVDVRGNVVSRAPTLALADARSDGVTLIGGWNRSATGNSVTCVTLSDNLVAGILNAVAVLANVGGASANSASLAGC